MDTNKVSPGNVPGKYYGEDVNRRGLFTGVRIKLQTRKTRRKLGGGLPSREDNAPEHKLPHTLSFQSEGVGTILQIK